MKKIFLSISLLCGVVCSFCQEAPPPPPMVIGGTVYTFQYEDIQGTPFLNDKWTRSMIITNDMKTYTNQPLKFDLYKNKFVFDRNNSIYELTPEANTVYLFPNEADPNEKIVYKKGYQINNFITPNNYLQVLAEGSKATLLKLHKKNMEEFTEYNDATKYKRFKVVQQYYVFQNGAYTLVTLGSKNLENVCQSKWKEVSAFLQQNNLSAKDEMGWAKAITYYNSL